MIRGSASRRSARRRGVPRIGRPRKWGLLRPLLGVVLATVAVLTPVESASLPAELEGLAGSAPVLAQGAVIDGMPDNCPMTPVVWYPTFTGSECQLDMEPCPATPVPGLGSSVLRFSVGYPDTDGLTLVEYPGFCELRILEVNDPAAYATCLAMTGFAVVDEDVDRVVGGVTQTVALCRLLHAAACPAGVRVDTDICRAVQRRTWTCQAGYRPMNEFNRCYQPPPQFPGTVHPACEAGAPTTFVAQDCADYVGDDFDPSPALIDCAVDYPTADPPDPTTALSANTKAGASSDFWCEFNTAHTRTVCHGRNRPVNECAPSTAMCLKRSTQTGGCSAIAKSIRCRAMEADYYAGHLTEVEVRRAGCQPCLVLPFEPLPPQCPDDLTAKTQLGWSSLFEVLEIGEDLYIGAGVCIVGGSRFDLAACLLIPNCDDPARGSLTLSSTHFSQVPVVNAPVIVSVRDIPVELRDGGLYFSGGRLKSRWDTLPYPVSAAGDFGYSMARFGSLDPSETGVSSVSSYVGRTGECVFRLEPQYQLTIRELWPDNPADLADIIALIGSDALDWWNALSPAERETRTLERGLGWWPSLAPADQDARVDEMTEVVPCNWSLPVWCRWTPTSTGYFKISGAAVWYTTRWYSGGRRILTATQAAGIDTALQDPTTRQRVADQLTNWELTPADVGLRDTLDGVLPLTGLDSDTRYSGIESRISCAGTDIRVYCVGTSTAGSTNYTETDPIGIAVHEVRVATRTPSS